MSSAQTARRKYSAEELHRLRNAYSMPRLEEAIEQREGEDAEIVKEHVLRGSKSFSARSFRSRNYARSLRVPSAMSKSENIPAATHIKDLRASSQDNYEVALNEIGPNNSNARLGIYKLGPSPTPSIKRKKAEAIVKAHGSPTHVRVTAGGRIVPSEQSPLCHPRYGYSAVKANGGLIKFAPNHHAGKAQWTQATENGFVAQDVHGNLCQIVDGMILPLNQVDGALRLYVPAPNLKVTQRGSSQDPAITQLSPNDDGQPSGPPAEPIFPVEPSLPAQISALEHEYAKLEHDLKDVDKTEVIHGRSMGKVAKEALVSRRRELVTSMDKVRRALKALKSQPSPNAPTSPRASTSRPPASPSFNRHPTYMPQLSAVDGLGISVNQHSFPYASGSTTANFNSSYSYRPMTALGELYPTQQPWCYPNPGMFLPTSYDGSLNPSFQPFGGQEFTPPFPQTSVNGQANTDENVPQNDGGGSQSERHVRSPCRSHALPIKPPEKASTNVKSNLNPMSPAYKPAKKHTSDRSNDDSIKSVSAHSSFGPLPESRQSRTKEIKSHEPSRVNSSPIKHGNTLHSSSISSFETADFFPRNTIEYSTRQRSLSGAHEVPREKENEDPDMSILPGVARPSTPHQTTLEHRWNLTSANASSYKDQSPQPEQPHVPAPPPGTPVHLDETSSKASASVVVTTYGSFLNRATHNISPKNKRGLLLAHGGSSEIDNGTPPHPDSLTTDQARPGNEKPPATMIDFSQKPREWIEGYQAGLRSHPVGADRGSDFLEGYCEGLLKSKPSTLVTSSVGNSTGSPMKSTSHRQSPLPPSWIPTHAKRGNDACDPINASVEDDYDKLEYLKQAIVAPHNEDAILTPSNEGPHVNEYPFSLGAWGKSHQSVPPKDAEPPVSRVFSDSKTLNPAAPVSNERRITSDNDTLHRARGRNLYSDPVFGSGNRDDPRDFTYANDFAREEPGDAGSPILHKIAPQSLNVYNHPGMRVGGLTSIDSAFHRPGFGHRILSPHLDINSASSVSRATSYFAPTQFDGVLPAPPSMRALDQEILMHNQNLGIPHNNSIASDRSMIITSTNEQRFLRDYPTTSSPASPPVLSPKLPAKKIPANNSPRKKPEAQSKTSSPAKSTFNNIAEKVGIKVSPNSKAAANDRTIAVSEQASPAGKRRWRDVWRSGRNDDGH